MLEPHGLFNTDNMLETKVGADFTIQISCLVKLTEKLRSIHHKCLWVSTKKPALTTSWCLSCWKLTSNQRSPCGLPLGLLHDVVGWKWLTRDWKVITISARFGTLVGLTTKKTCTAENLTLNRFSFFDYQCLESVDLFDIKVATVQKMVCVSAMCWYFWRFWRIFGVEVLLIAVPTSRFFSKLKTETCRCGVWIILLKLTAPCIAGTAKACAHGPFVLKDGGNHPGCTLWEASCGRCAWICFLRNLRFCRIRAVKVLQPVAGRSTQIWRSENHTRFQGNARRMLKQDFRALRSVVRDY